MTKPRLAEYGPFLLGEWALLVELVERAPRPFASDVRQQIIPFRSHPSMIVIPDAGRKRLLEAILADLDRKSVAWLGYRIIPESPEHLALLRKLDPDGATPTVREGELREVMRVLAVSAASICGETWPPATAEGSRGRSRSRRPASAPSMEQVFELALQHAQRYSAALGVRPSPITNAELK